MKNTQFFFSLIQPQTNMNIYIFEIGDFNKIKISEILPINCAQTFDHTNYGAAKSAKTIFLHLKNFGCTGVIVSAYYRNFKNEPQHIKLTIGVIFFVKMKTSIQNLKINRINSYTKL